MKLFLKLILFLIWLTPALAEPTDKFEYSKQNSNYNVEIGQAPIGYFLTHFAQHSGIGIEYDKRLTDNVNVSFHDVTDATLIRWLEKNFSTIKGMDGNGKIITLKVLPKGEFSSLHLVSANDPIAEGVFHAEGKGNAKAQQRYQQRLNRLDELVRNEQQERIRTALKRKKERQVRKQAREEKRASERKALEEKLAQFKDKDPEIYQRLLDNNRHRFPDLVIEEPK